MCLAQYPLKKLFIHGNCSSGIIIPTFSEKFVRWCYTCPVPPSPLRGGTETNRQCFADICKSRQSRFDSKSGIYCRIDALKTISTAQIHLDNKHTQLILPMCARFIANLALPTLADIGKALPISFRAAPN